MKQTCSRLKRRSNYRHSNGITKTFTSSRYFWKCFGVRPLAEEDRSSVSTPVWWPWTLNSCIGPRINAIVEVLSSLWNFISFLWEFCLQLLLSHSGPMLKRPKIWPRLDAEGWTCYEPIALCQFFSWCTTTVLLPNWDFLTWQLPLHQLFIILVKRYLFPAPST